MEEIYLADHSNDILLQDFYYCAKRGFMAGYKGKTVLVYGASGMIGSYILGVLNTLYILYGYMMHIIGVSRNNRLNRLRYQKFSNIFEFIDMDVCGTDIEMPEHDIAFFAAGNTDYTVCDTKPDAIYTVNTIGLHNALFSARKSSCEVFLYLSSASVYGDVGNDDMRENQVGGSLFYKPDQVYGQSKRMAECICNCNSKEYGMDVRVARPFHMYGPGMNLNNSNLVYDSIKRALHQEDILMRSDGSAKRNMSYMRDIIRQIFLVALVDKKNITINLGTYGNNITVMEWMETLGAVTGCTVRRQHTRKESNPTNSLDMCPNLERIMDLENRYDRNNVNHGIEEGIRRTIKYYEVPRF